VSRRIAQSISVNNLESLGLSYLNLPFLVGRPGLGHSLDDAGLVTNLIPVNELLCSQVIDVDPLDVVDEIVRYLADLVLLVEVLIC